MVVLHAPAAAISCFLGGGRNLHRANHVRVDKVEAWKKKKNFTPIQPRRVD